jgi:hypothetical protein
MLAVAALSAAVICAAVADWAMVVLRGLEGDVFDPTPS